MLKCAGSSEGQRYLRIGRRRRRHKNMKGQANIPDPGGPLIERDALDAESAHALEEEGEAKCPAAYLVRKGLRVDIDAANGFKGARELLESNIFPGQLNLQ